MKFSLLRRASGDWQGLGFRIDKVRDGIRVVNFSASLHRKGKRVGRRRVAGLERAGFLTGRIADATAEEQEEDEGLGLGTHHL